MDVLLRDVRFAARSLWRDRGFAAAVLVTLALSIAANVTIFTVVYSVLLKPLPVPESGRILVMSNLYPGAGLSSGGLGWSGVPDYYDRLREVDVFEEQALFRGQGFNIGPAGSAERVDAMGVTPSFFRLLRVAPFRGRTFTDDEGEIGNERKVVLSYPLWQRLFAGDAGAVSRDVQINGRAYTIVGVMPPDFEFLDPEVLLWVPLAFTNEQKEARHSNSWTNIGRLKPGRAVEQAQTQIDALNARNLERFPEMREAITNVGFHTMVKPLKDAVVEPAQGQLHLLWGGVACVLLIGFINVANLVLVRSSVRLRELATRAALGASRLRMSRQLVTETLLLALVAGALGLLAGRAGLVLLSDLGLEDVPRATGVAMDPIVIWLTLGLAALVGLALGAIPVATMLKADLHALLRQESRGGTSGRAARTFRNTLVVAQVSAACVLLTGALLLLASFRAVASVDPGFPPDNLLTASVSLPTVRYAEPDDLRSFAARAVESLREIPGVIEAGLTTNLPFGGNFNSSLVQAVGYVPAPGESLIAPHRVTVDTGYLRAMGILLIEGRYFDERDTATSEPVVIVDEQLARRFWPNSSPLGQQVFTDVRQGPDTRLYTVVGVVGHIAMVGLVSPSGFTPTGAYYFPEPQQPMRQPTFAIRTERDPTTVTTAVRTAMAALDPELPLFDVRTMAERIDTSLNSRRAPMLLATAFALAAVLLSAVGIYGVLAYRVTQRTREIGIRVALGSRSAEIFRLILFEGARLLALGLVAGAAVGFVMQRAIEAQLYGVEPTDPLLLAASVSLLSLVALLACALPARRATRLDPVAALGSE